MRRGTPVDLDGRTDSARRDEQLACRRKGSGVLPGELGAAVGQPFGVRQTGRELATVGVDGPQQMG